MPVVIRVQVGGGVVPITNTTRKVKNDNTDGDRQRVNGWRVTIVGPTGTTLVNAGSPVYDVKGRAVYYWNIAGLAVGDYKVTWSTGVGFNTATGTVQNKVLRSVIIRLVSIL